MRWITALFRVSYRPRTPRTLLGRWGRHEDDSTLAYKVYLANHDHCGPCGTLRLDAGARVTRAGPILDPR